MSIRVRRSLSFLAVAAAALLLTACIPAVVGGGIFVVGVGAAIVVSGCDEAASVQVWDHTASHPVCDAVVTAEREGHVVAFSPCYQTYLGTGVWKVVARKPGMPIATGTIVVDKDRRCSQPTYHSLELTLGSEADVSPSPLVAPPPSRPPPSPAPPAAPADTSAAPSSSINPSPAPSSGVPSAAFPTAVPSGAAVPAPPTR
jgi:hypothetical protein